MNTHLKTPFGVLLLEKQILCSSSDVMRVQFSQGWCLTVSLKATFTVKVNELRVTDTMSNDNDNEVRRIRQKSRTSNPASEVSPESIR